MKAEKNALFFLQKCNLYSQSVFSFNLSGVLFHHYPLEPEEGHADNVWENIVRKIYIKCRFVRHSRNKAGQLSAAQ